MIKRNIILLLCTVLLITFLTACGGNEENSEIAGNWIPTTATINGTTVQYSSLDLDENQFKLDFEPDGKCELTLTGMTTKGTYVFSGTSVDITANSEEYKLDYSSGTLTLSIDNDSSPMSISFIRERD